MEKPLGTMPQPQLIKFVSPWSPAPPPLPCFLCSWWGMVKSRCRFTLSSSCLATSPRGRAGPWEGSTVKPHTSITQPASHICKPSKYHLIGPSSPFEPAEEKVLLNCSVGRAEFIQMEELAETTEQIPATNPFHTSEKRERNGRGRPKQTSFGKLEAVGWNFQLFLFFSHSFWGACSSQKSRTLLLGFGLLQKKGSSFPITKQALFPTSSAKFSWNLSFLWGIREVPFFSRKVYAVGIPSACLSVACTQF